jgi:hypothetical protein
MFSHNSRKALATALAGAALASAVGASGATADEYMDLRSPDAQDATTVEKPYKDLRMPDSREPQSPAAPDTRPVADEPSTPGAFDWLSAALGAAAGAGIVLVLFAGGGLRRLSSPARA